MPLAEIHPHAQHAAEAAEAAAVQGRFGAMHDALFENQRALADGDLVRYAGDIGLDVARFQGELEDHARSARVREDFRSGVHSGVNGTPTFFINGLRHDAAWDVETLMEALEAAFPVMRGEGEHGHKTCDPPALRRRESEPRRPTA